MDSNLFKKYHDRLTREGVIKSLLFGLIIGFSALILCTLISWFVGFKAGLYVGIAVFVVGTAAATPILYFAKFRPTTKDIARRIDELGLEERVITMTELEGDDSYIARAQREDTMRALGKVNHLLLKIAVSVALCATVGVIAFLGVGSTTVDALYTAGVIDSGVELIKSSANDKGKTYKLTYSVSKGGIGKIVYWNEDFDTENVFDEDYVEVEEGGSGPRLYAYSEGDWTFAGWSDGVETPYRHDVDIQNDIKVEAIFKQCAVDEFPDDDGLLSDDGNGNGNGNGQPAPGGQDGPPPESGSPSDPNADPADGAGGNGLPNNQIRDGETFYGDRYSDDRSDAMDRLGSDDTMDEGLKGGINDYFDSIEKDGSDSGDGNP